MNDMYFQSEEYLKCFIKNLQFIGLGSEGICYKIDKTTIFKHLCGPNYEQRSKEEILQFKDINIPNYVFAQNVVYLKKEIIGILMQYINGENLEIHKLYKIRIVNLIKAFDDLIVATRKLSNLGIGVFDVCSVNVIYSNIRLYLIDTMNYSRVDIDSEKLFKENMARIVWNIHSAIIPYKVIKFIYSIPELKDFKDDKELLSNPSYFLRILLKELNSYIGYEIKTLEEASKKLKY